MKKRKLILLIVLVCLAIGGIGIIAVKGYGFTIGRFMILNDKYLIVNEDTAMYFSIPERLEKKIEKMSVGDEIMIVHGGVLTSFPGQTDAQLIVRLSMGDESDIPQETLERFIVPTEETTIYNPGFMVSCSYEDEYVLLQIPEDWEYELKEYEENNYQQFGIYFWPAGQSEGKLALMCAGKQWGVCGTGLKIKEIMLGEYSAAEYVYDNSDLWTFIHFDYPDIHYVVFNEGAEAWWDEYGTEAMRILSTVQLPK